MKREEIEQYSKENSGLFHFTTVRNLALSLLAEMDKPKVWDFAFDEADGAIITFYQNDSPVGVKVPFKRQAIKTRARTIAEDTWSTFLAKEVKRGEDYIDAIEAAILKREAELRGES